MTLQSELPTPGTRRGLEASQLPLGYASPVPVARPGRPLWSALATLAAGLVLLGLALYALLYLVRSVTVPEGLAPRGSSWEVVMAVVLIFAGICTVVGLLFLGIGVLRVGGHSR